IEEQRTNSSPNFRYTKQCIVSMQLCRRFALLRLNVDRIVILRGANSIKQRVNKRGFDFVPLQLKLWILLEVYKDVIVACDWLALKEFVYRSLDVRVGFITISGKVAQHTNVDPNNQWSS